MSILTWLVGDVDRPRTFHITTGAGAGGTSEVTVTAEELLSHDTVGEMAKLIAAKVDEIGRELRGALAVSFREKRDELQLELREERRQIIRQRNAVRQSLGYDDTKQAARDVNILLNDIEALFAEVKRLRTQR
jgi:hypothetical protein